MRFSKQFIMFYIYSLHWLYFQTEYNHKKQSSVDNFPDGSIFFLRH